MRFRTYVSVSYTHFFDLIEYQVSLGQSCCLYSIHQFQNPIAACTLWLQIQRLTIPNGNGSILRIISGPWTSSVSQTFDNNCNSSKAVSFSSFSTAAMIHSERLTQTRWCRRHLNLESKKGLNVAIRRFVSPTGIVASYSFCCPETQTGKEFNIWVLL